MKIHVHVVMHYSRLHFLTAVETMSSLVVLQTDVFGCEQLSQTDNLESLNRQWEPTDLANFDDSVLDDYLSGRVDLLVKLVIFALIISMFLT